MKSQRHDASGRDGRFLRRSASRRRLLAAITAYRLERRALGNWMPYHEANAIGDSQPSHPAEESRKVSCAAEELLDEAEKAIGKWWADLDQRLRMPSCCPASRYPQL